MVTIPLRKAGKGDKMSSLEIFCLIWDTLSEVILDSHCSQRAENQGTDCQATTRNLSCYPKSYSTESSEALLKKGSPYREPIKFNREASRLGDVGLKEYMYL